MVDEASTEFTFFMLEFPVKVLMEVTGTALLFSFFFSQPEVAVLVMAPPLYSSTCV